MTIPAWADLADAKAYGAWRAQKLAHYPTDANALVVDVQDLAAPNAEELQRLRSLCAAANMAIYRTANTSDDEMRDRRALAAFGARLGLTAMEDHRSREGDGIVRIAVSEEAARNLYIPYTNRPIAWHTDGYYNFHGANCAVQSMLLHCKSDAEGGENGLLDQEILYIRLRDEDPALIAALMADDAMTIPANREPDGSERPANVGPVFYFGATGRLGMRYTARKRNIAWSQRSDVQRAAEAIARILKDEPLVLRLKLRPGWGLVCNNVLHDRSGFSNNEGGGRLLYRIRYRDRVASA
ncbi:MAG: TauD/TfdA family dioxygenase [Hyphomicrobiales bacterium]|nr:TauD/TfdA family dioxygenase [Hyphomicrobiales bacterium]